MSYPNLTQDAIETLTIFFQWVDTDHDGYISIEEIKNACVVDRDGNGTITQEEIDACAAPWIAALPDEDMNNDQKLTLEELLSYNNNAKTL